MMGSRKTLFLPGAAASALFWKPVADLLNVPSVLFAWPGLGNEPANPAVNTLDDLVGLVLREIDEPVNIVAQSLGGLIAIKCALAAPTRVERLVLAVTSGGVPVAELGGAPWRENYFRKYPHAARWLAEPVEDMSQRIPSITTPTLLLWGDADAISPISVGDRLLSLLPNARLRIFPGADHDLAVTRSALIADEISRHFA